MALAVAAMPDNATRTIAEIFANRMVTPKLTASEAPRTVLGLKNAHPEDEEDGSDDAPQLNWWQAANIRLLSDFLERDEDARQSDGIILCDAPGLGKTLSVLATVVNTKVQVADDKRLVIVFAGRGIIPQWAEQVSRHLDAQTSGMPVYCADAERLKHAEATPLSERPPGERGGCYVDERPTARLPGQDVLRSFDVLLLAKEILSQDPHNPTKNIAVVKSLSRFTRLVVIDESHNLNKRNVSRGELNLNSLQGVPKLLLTGTPGNTPAELYQMLRLVNHRSLYVASEAGNRGLHGGNRALQRAGRAGAVKRDDEGTVAAAAAAPLQQMDVKKWMGEFFMDKSERVWRDKLDALLAILRSCFLHTPATAAPNLGGDPITERIELTPLEVESYNFALSLHQRDVIRAGRGATQPAEWQRTRPSDGWYVEKKKRGANEPTPPSGQKTVGDLMRAANGGEDWSLTMHGGGPAPAGIRRALAMGAEDEGGADCPTCYKCQLPVPGLLTLPCGCLSEVCPECFTTYRCHQFERKQKKFRCPRNCQKRQRPFDEWLAEQPRLVLQTDDERMRRREDNESAAVQKKQRTETGDRDATLRKTVPARPFKALRLPKMLACVSAAEIERRAHLLDAGAKLLYLAQELGDLARKGDGAKVYITPPANTAVRTRFVSQLCQLVGKEAVADLNVKERAADKGTERAKYTRGYGLYWQCQSCGDVHEQSTARCTTSTCAVTVNGGGEVLCHLHDVTKVKGANDSETIYIGSTVDVYRPGTRSLLGRGQIRLIGTCKGKRPDGKARFHPAPAGSCFVLIMVPTPQGMAGLDLPEATHMYQMEPILREDTEEQARARGQRIGGQGRPLEIVQLLNAGTIEELQHNDLKEIRRRRLGKRGGKKFAAECEGEQAQMLSALRLLRPDGAALEEARAARAAAQEAGWGEEEDDEDDDEEDDEEEGRKEEEDAMEEALVEKDDEDVEAGAEEEGVQMGVEDAVVKVEDEDILVHSLRASRRAAVEEASWEVCEARALLLDVENDVAIEHVTPCFVKSLRQWRRQLKRALTLGAVASSMRELREGTLDEHSGRSLFDAGWEEQGPHHQQWLEASQADDLDHARLIGLLEQLRQSYIGRGSVRAAEPPPPPQPQPTPLPPSQPRMATPAAAPSASGLPTPATQLANELTPLINWSKASGDKLRLALDWCEEKGADSLEELVEAEMVDVFVDALGLKQVQSEILRKRIRAAA